MVNIHKSPYISHIVHINHHEFSIYFQFTWVPHNITSHFQGYHRWSQPWTGPQDSTGPGFLMAEVWMTPLVSSGDPTSRVGSRSRRLAGYQLDFDWNWYIYIYISSKNIHILTGYQSDWHVFFWAKFSWLVMAGAPWQHQRPAVELLREVPWAGVGWMGGFHPEKCVGTGEIVWFSIIYSNPQKDIWKSVEFHEWEITVLFFLGVTKKDDLIWLTRNQLRFNWSHCRFNMITQGKFESNHGDFTMNLRMEISIRKRPFRWLPNTGISIEFQLWDWMGSRIVEPQIIQKFIHFIPIGSMVLVYMLTLRVYWW